MAEFAAQVEKVATRAHERAPITAPAVEAAKERLGDGGKEGFDSFIGEWKKGSSFEQMYRFWGRHWIKVLSGKEKTALQKLIRRVVR